MSQFVHLHVHSQYSILDGQASIQRLVDKAMADGQPGIAITDHGDMFGIKEFYNYVKKVKGKYKDKAAECEKRLAALRDGTEQADDPQAEIAACEKQLDDLRRKMAFKPIIGCEVYMCEDMHRRGEGGGISGGYSYRVVHVADERWMAVFLDSSQQLRSVMTTALLSLAFMAGCVALVYLIVVLCSRRAIEPVVQANRKQKQFITDASHELKTPLAGIRLLTDSILQTEDMNADTTREFVEDIGREAQRLSRITEDLLRLTRLDSGIQDAAYPVSVSRVLERVVRMLGVVAREKEVTLTYETDEDAVVRATEDDIHQILYNLMENGIKYSGSMGFVHTTLKTVGDTVVISVEDNGIGIPDEDMEHVFERFYRVDKNRSRAVGGTGLGLSIVSDTVRRRGGSIRAQHRQSGSGTVFIVELPLARREEADE